MHRISRYRKSRIPRRYAELKEEFLLAQHALLAEEYRFGFSGGCVSFHEADHSYRDALLRADALLYEAKKQGKGNILLAGSGLTGPDIFS